MAESASRSYTISATCEVLNMLLFSKWSRFVRNDAGHDSDNESAQTSFNAALSATADCSSRSLTSCAVACNSDKRQAIHTIRYLFILIILIILIILKKLMSVLHAFGILIVLA